MIKTRLLGIAMMIMVPSIGNSQDMINSIQNILIRNVIVIDQTGQAEDVMVEVLLKQQNSFEGGRYCF
jgi:hypothetical protein